MTIENTEPLKIYYNWVNFDKEKSPPYRQCFETGAWYYRGSHKVTGPPSGNFERCADPNEHSAQQKRDNFLKYLYQTNCWGKCDEKWVLTDDVVSYVKTSVQESLKELEETLRVPKLKGRLKFQRGPGNYPALYDSWGYSSADILKERCNPDAYFSGAPFEESWCTEGLPAGYNFVLTITNLHHSIMMAAAVARVSCTLSAVQSAQQLLTRFQNILFNRRAKAFDNLVDQSRVLTK